MNVASLESAADLAVYELLEDFIAKLRRKEGVSVREFASQHPEHSQRILADFPALLMAEGLKPRVSCAPGTEEAVVAAQPPELIAGYKVLAEIGKGGMGVVYQAQHPSLSRELAIKVLLRRKGRSTLPERFRREAEAASKLDHPNIVPVFDFGEQSGVSYLVMPLVDGVSFDHLLETHREANRSASGSQSMADRTSAVSSRSAALSAAVSSAASDIIGETANFKKLARIGAEAASALAHAHELNTIHRDIKPGNLILDTKSKIWVTDFGLAKVLDDESDLSRTGDVIGTPRYMAPEQMRGLCDARSDVYSLGVTLYEMASGKRAWDSHSPTQLLKARASADLPELSEEAPFIPKPLAEIIMKACSFRPEDRYQSAGELQVVLNRFAHGQKTGDRRRRSRDQGSFFHRKRTVAGLLVLIPTVTLLTMYGFKAGPWADPDSTQDALLSLVQDESKREVVIEQLPDIIEAALTSQDDNVREQAADLTLKVFEQALSKSNLDDERKKLALEQLNEASTEYREVGFKYSDFDHPLSNAVRNLDLANQLAPLDLNAITSLTCKFRIAGLGDLLQPDLIPQKHVEALLSLLPREAQDGPCEQLVEKENLVQFLHVMNYAYAVVSKDPNAGKYIQDHQISRQFLKPSGLPDGSQPAARRFLDLPKDFKIDDTMKQKLLEAAAKHKQALERNGR